MTPAVITENKHLSAVLEHIKAEKDKAPSKKKTRYELTGRRNDGWNSNLARSVKVRTEMVSKAAE